MQVISGLHPVDGSCAGLIGRTGVEGLDVAEQDEGIGTHELCHQSSEPVVVSESDLVRCDGVVLVDDREDPQSQKALHGSARVGPGRRILEVAGGQQHLAGEDAEPVEAGLIPPHEHVLTDSCRCLLRRKVIRATFELQERERRRDRARRHEDDLGVSTVRGGNRGDDRVDAPRVLTADRG